MEAGYFFQSMMFDIKVGEDQETNPGCYGQVLAEWLCEKLKAYYPDADVVPEDWGWCVMCSCEDFLLWVGCGAMQTEESLAHYDEKAPPKGEAVVWHAFPHVEVPFFMFETRFRQWTGAIDLDGPLKELDTRLQTILNSEERIQFCEQPENSFH
ncbi:hypothetical protein [Algicola sagamiensis]|uniref:hypothetical protein n=1 Tax=Algicola sagamiensis TaxID=163869 RepID=UPI000363C1BA|nr:hypothetical protein [Algicola sagamiensis]